MSIRFPARSPAYVFVVTVCHDVKANEPCLLSYTFLVVAFDRDRALEIGQILANEMLQRTETPDRVHSLRHAIGDNLVVEARRMQVIDAIAEEVVT